MNVVVKVAIKSGNKNVSTYDQNQVLKELVAFLKANGRRNAMLVPASCGASGFLVFDNEASAERALTVIDNKAKKGSFKVNENSQGLITLTLYVN